MKIFSLRPHATSPLAGIQLGGAIYRQQNSISIWFQLRGDLAQIKMGKGGQQGRCHDLWRKTCFEVFIARPESPAYWELNVSPMGEWNIYSFSECRRGMQEEVGIEQVSVTTYQTEDSFTLHCNLCLDKILFPNYPLQIAACAVLQDREGLCSYWALEHGEGPPDFHNRKKFLLNI
ncbi:DOMON-like domain-containing protein [Desulfotalea psychrophila]|uniref:DOMON-like domain-containing protein n=1 Tax=Desulfotalea psychrophila (strain LSv54 / DSM 12343) TaxID=177439 RepID=Q6AQL9_DESPS|nr:DOMON-like domain-containing protein [Desulfotalea psychrophila]CAG35354.1 conserved hypothetical protein [Desulfotalea psychrophila LSv54]